MRMLEHPILVPMKRIITLLILLLSIAQLDAQRNLAEPRPVWFGVNMGGTWQTSDMKPVAGIGWGFTVARYSRISNPSPLYWGWRARFLDGRNFGYNYHPLYGIKANPVLSGYYSGTDPDTGHVFSNYKMRYDEFAFELIVGSNTLRKHGVLLYGWGGAGATFWKTSTNLKDASGNYYDYSTVNAGGDEDLVKADLDAMLDETYETNANGSGTAGQWGFMPSAGIGFGYQWSNFAIIAEHKTTWALNDNIDGTNHDGTGVATGNNDIYHYDGLTLKWNFNTQHNTNNNNNPPPPPAPDYTHNQPPPPNPNPTPDPIVNPTPDPDPNPHNTPAIQPPTVQFTTPAVDPYVTNVLNQNLVVRVTNVTTSNQISLTINNQVSTNFSFNPVTNTMTFAHTLLAGNNVYKVVATNAAGSAQDVQTITYKGQSDPVPPSPLPPQVTITTPSTDPYTSVTQTYTVTATVLNVPNQSAITVTRNGSPVTNFSYNQQTNKVTFTANLQSGANLYNIVGTNSVGTASDAVTINYGTTNSGPQPPVVTITSPTACPFQTKTQAQTITASITNVTQASQVNVVFNGQPVTNFTFSGHGATANISFNVQLVSGANPFTVSATNTAGTDSKACTITYKPNTTPVTPPDVEITTPSSTPFATSNAAFTLKATVLNVAGSSEITVSSNNAVIVGWTYDMNTKVLTYNTTLPIGTTNYVVTATNANGTDSDNQSVTYQPAVPSSLPPTVTITNPATSPFTVSSPAQTITATVTNITQQSQITVTKAPHTSVPFTFNPSTHVVTFSVTLPTGSTSFTVTATNTAGSANDQVTLKYEKGSSNPTPGGGNTPVETPGGGRPTGPPPSIDLHVPSMSPVATGTQQFPVTMIVTGVTSQSDIIVKVNGVQMTSGVTFNASSGTLTFTASLVQGANNISVRATNANGNATKSLVVNYTAGSRLQDPSPSNTPSEEQPKQSKDKEEPKKAEVKPSEPKKDEPKKDPSPRPVPSKEEPKKADPPKPTASPAPAPAPSPAPKADPTPSRGSSPAPAPSPSRPR